ncbi:glutamate receptor 1.3-like [Gossypium australe]|uniref:Glutamate receptor 1.3-like n=1 Tax=Gossypium australe TaxID=47621 RepID=A0A5B6UL28_9ROSI|nr:glutamate receptor 1.3-like [Gossypium australe]
MGIGMVTGLPPKESQNLWIFLKPLSPGLWLTIVGVYVISALFIWLIERPAFVERQTRQSNGEIGRMFGFSFSIFVFAHWEKLSSNLSRSVVVLWVCVVFILGSNYTATLTSMMTVQQIEFNSGKSIIGRATGPVTQGAIGNLNFPNSHSKSIRLTSLEEYAKALSEGSKNGGVSAIIEEMPYINILRQKYPTRYSMVGHVMPVTNGFGFAFPKGSLMAHDISREIAKLREDGMLQRLENEWFKSPIIDFDSDTTSDSMNSLTVRDFRGLFLVNGIYLAIACFLFLTSLLYKNFHVMKEWRRPEFVKQYICMKFFRNKRDAKAVHPDLLGELNGQVGGLRPAVGGGEVGVGLIADMGSKEGKIIQSCLSMAISDFYGLHRDYQMRIVLHTRDSKGDPLLALSAAFKLSEDNKVKVILSAQKSTLEAKFLAEFGDHTKIPVISIQGFIDFMHLLSSSTIDESSPRGRMMQTSSKTLRIAVPTTNGFPQLLKVDHDPHTNTTIFSGFCIDAFKIAMAGLNYQVFYQFVPFEYNNPNIGEAYDDLIYQVYLQNYDAVVGDITITANRSSYVDFTLPYTDMGVGMVTRLSPKDSQNLWIFLKPLTPGLWLTMVGVYVVTALVIWLIERPAFVEQQTQQSNGRIGRMGEIIKQFIEIRGCFVGVCGVHIGFELHCHFDIDDDGPAD